MSRGGKERGSGIDLRRVHPLYIIAAIFIVYGCVQTAPIIPAAFSYRPVVEGTSDDPDRDPEAVPAETGPIIQIEPPRPVTPNTQSHEITIGENQSATVYTLNHTDFSARFGDQREAMVAVDCGCGEVTSLCEARNYTEEQNGLVPLELEGYSKKPIVRKEGGMFGVEKLVVPGYCIEGYEDDDDTGKLFELE